MIFIRPNALDIKTVPGAFREAHLYKETKAMLKKYMIMFWLGHYYQGFKTIYCGPIETAMLFDSAEEAAAMIEKNWLVRYCGGRVISVVIVIEFWRDLFYLQRPGQPEPIGPLATAQYFGSVEAAVAMVTENPWIPNYEGKVVLLRNI